MPEKIDLRSRAGAGRMRQQHRQSRLAARRAAELSRSSFEYSGDASSSNCATAARSSIRPPPRNANRQADDDDLPGGWGIQLVRRYMDEIHLPTRSRRKRPAPDQTADIAAAGNNLRSAQTLNHRKPKNAKPMPLEIQIQKSSRARRRAQSPSNSTAVSTPPPRPTWKNSSRRCSPVRSKISFSTSHS